MWQIIYSEKFTEKLAKVDPVTQVRIREALENQRWTRIPTQMSASWLRFISDFSARGYRNYYVLYETDSRRSTVTILYIVFESERHGKG